MLEAPMDRDAVLELHTQFKEFVLYNEDLTNFAVLYRLAYLPTDKLSEEDIRTISVFLPIAKEYLATSETIQKKTLLLREYTAAISKYSYIKRQMDEADGLGMNGLYLTLFEQLQDQIELSNHLKNGIRELDSIIEEELRTALLLQSELLGNRRTTSY
jgi:hypothetical protein